MDNLNIRKPESYSIVGSVKIKSKNKSFGNLIQISPNKNDNRKRKFEQNQVLRKFQSTFNAFFEYLTIDPNKITRAGFYTKWQKKYLTYCGIGDFF